MRVFRPKGNFGTFFTISLYIKLKNIEIKLEIKIPFFLSLKNLTKGGTKCGMLDFVKIRVKETKNGFIVYPEFLIEEYEDLMTKGGKFYAVYNEQSGLWSRTDITVRRLVDAATLEECDRLQKENCNA